MRSVSYQLPLFLSLLFGLSGCSQSPITWWRSLNKKAHELSVLEANYKALQTEHEKLKKEYYRLEAEAVELRAKVESVEGGERNLKATGSLGGRALSSIAYEGPKGLSLEEALALGFEQIGRAHV